MPEKTLFRQKAIMAYKRNMEKDVVLRFISWPIIMSLWLLLGVLFLAGLFVWYAQVPVYVNTSGILLAQNQTTVAVVFLSPDQSAHLHVGLPAGIQIGSASTQVQSTVVQVEPDIMSPEAIRQRFQLHGSNALLITQPARVAIIKPVTALSATVYAGSNVNARVEIGSQRLLSLLFGSNQFVGSNV